MLCKLYQKHVAYFNTKRLPFGNDPHTIISPPPLLRRVICKLLLKTFRTQHIQVGKFGIISVECLFHIKNAY